MAMAIPDFYLAAAVVVAAAVVALGIVAAAAEQNQQDDDPAQITATETVVIHRKYLQMFFCGCFAAHSKIFRRPKNVR